MAGARDIERLAKRHGVGYKTLAVDVVEDRHLLEPADGE